MNRLIHIKKGNGKIYCSFIINPNSPMAFIENDKLYSPELIEINQSNYKELGICENCLRNCIPSAFMAWKKKESNQFNNKKKGDKTMKKINLKTKENNGKKIDLMKIKAMQEQQKKKKSKKPIDFQKKLDQFKKSHPNRQFKLIQFPEVSKVIELPQKTFSSLVNQFKIDQSNQVNQLMLPEYCQSLEIVREMVNHLPEINSINYNDNGAIEFVFPELNMKLIKGFDNQWCYIEKEFDQLGRCKTKSVSNWMTFDDAIQLGKQLAV